MGHEICQTCGLPIPGKKFDPLSIVCSEYHARCIRCLWPVGKNLMPEDGICNMCKLCVKRKRNSV
jgi:hypothetical protein